MGNEIHLTEKQFNFVIKTMVSKGAKLEAIKLVQSVFDYSLADSKEYVEIAAGSL